MAALANNLIVRNGWLNGATKTVDHGAGDTLGDIATKLVPAAVRQYVRCQVNGIEHPAWDNVIPNDHDHYLLYVMPQGDNSKESLGFIAAIALSFASGGVTGFLTESWGWSTLAANVTYMVGSSLILSAVQRSLYKPPDQPSYDYGTGSNPFFSFTGTSNRYEPWGTVPRIYGRIRVAPKLFQKPLTYIVGNTEYIRMGFDFGYGPLFLSDMKIGETLLSSFSGVKTSYHPYFTKGDVLDFFDSDYEIDALNVVLPYDTTIIPTTTPVDTYKVSLDFYAPQGLYYINNSTGKRGRTERYINVYVREIIGGVPGAWTQATYYAQISTSQAILPGAPQVNNDPKCDLRNLDVWYENGVWNYGFKAGRATLQYYVEPELIVDFMGVVGWDVYIYDAGGQMPNGQPYTILDTNSSTRLVTVSYTGVQVVFQTFPTFYDVPVSRSYQAYFGGATSDQPENVGYRVGIYNIGGTATFDPFPFAVILNFFRPGQYEVGVQDSNSIEPSGDPNAPYTYINRVDYIKAVSYTNAGESILKPDVTHTILELEMPATDQLNGTIQEFNCIAHSLLPVWNGSVWLQPPTYNRTTKIWSGWPVVVRNPAWIYCDILRGTTNKNPVPDSKIDLETIRQWGLENDIIPANDPNAPSGYCCDMIIDGEATVKDALKNVASVGRATPARKDSKFSVVMDTQNRTPVQLISEKNCTSFSSEMNYVKLPHGLKISFLDEADGFLNKEVIVYTQGYNETGTNGNAVATVFETLSLPGTTRIEQARRLGRYYLATAQLQRERINCVLDYEQLVVQRGDLCLVASTTIKTGGYPVRVVDVTQDATNGHVLTLDEPIASLNAIRYRATDTVIQVTQVANDQIRLPPGQAAPDKYDLIEYGVSHETKAPFIVEEITPADAWGAALRLVEFRPEIEQAVLTEIIPDRIPRPGASNNFVTGPITDLKVVSNPYYEQGYKYTRFDLTWLPPRPGFADFYNVYIFLNGLPQYVAKTYEINFMGVNTVNISDLTTATTFKFGVEPVIYRVGVGPMSTVQVTVAPDTDPPADIVGFGCNAQTGTLMLYWDKSTDPDIHHFEIRYSPDTSVEWPHSTLLVDNIPPTLTEFVVPLRPGLYLIKSVDGAGNFSVNAAATVVQVSDLEYVTEFLVIDFAPFSTGAYDDVEKRSNLDELILSQNQSVGYYIPPTGEGLHFVELTKTRLYAALELELVAFDELLNSPWFDPMNTAVPISPSGLLTSNIVDASIQFRYRTDPANNYSIWYNLFVADVTATDIEFRVKLNTREPGYTPTVKYASVKADWLERKETGENVAVPAAGLNVSFEFNFMQRPNMGITLENANVGDYYKLTSVTVSGFTIQVFNSSGVGIAGQIDWIASGYGKTYPGGAATLQQRFII